MGLDGKRMTCSICGSEEHFRMECPKRQRPKFGTKVQSNAGKGSRGSQPSNRYVADDRTGDEEPQRDSKHARALAPEGGYHLRAPSVMDRVLSVTPQKHVVQDPMMHFPVFVLDNDESNDDREESVSAQAYFDTSD